MSKTLEDLGYEKVTESPSILIYEKGMADGFYDYTITFYKKTKNVVKTRGYSDATCLTMEELKAIYQYCIDNKWI